MKVFVTVDPDSNIIVFASKYAAIKGYRELIGEEESAKLSDEEVLEALSDSVITAECEVVGGLTLREKK